MSWEPVEVIAYAGHRGEESPRTLILEGKRIEVKKILDRWSEEEAETGERRRCFKVKGSDFRTRVVCYDEGRMEWRCLR